MGRGWYNDHNVKRQVTCKFYFVCLPFQCGFWIIISLAQNVGPFGRAIFEMKSDEKYFFFFQELFRIFEWGNKRPQRNENTIPKMSFF